jgi:hypothetical protein
MSHYLVMNHLYEDGDGVVRQRPIASFAETEEKCLTCSKVALLSWLTLRPDQIIFPATN